MDKVPPPSYSGPVAAVNIRATSAAFPHRITGTGLDMVVVVVVVVGAGARTLKKGLR
jgi:hypothetical protein